MTPPPPPPPPPRRLKPSDGSDGSPPVQDAPVCTPDIWQRWWGGRRALSAASLSHLSSICPAKTWETRPPTRNPCNNIPHAPCQHKLFSQECWVQLFPGSQKNGSWSGSKVLTARLRSPELASLSPPGSGGPSCFAGSH